MKREGGAMMKRLMVAALVLLPAIAGAQEYIRYTPGGMIYLADGTVAAPGLAFASNPKTGIYNIGGNILVFSLNGVQYGVMSGSAFQYNGPFYIGASDLILSRAAAATLQLGTVDAAAPIAQTLQAQGVAAGTSDISGANLTITSGNGRGSAAGSSLIFRTPSPVGGGNGAQTMTDRLTITTTATFSANVYTPTGNGFWNSSNLTAATMTNELAPGYSKLATYTSSYTWTNAMLTAGGAATTWDVTVATLPAKTQVINAIVVIITSQTAAGTLTVQCGDDATFINYVKAGDAKAAANTVYGDLISGAETGTALFDATAKWIPAYLPSYTGTTSVACRFISNAAMSTMTTSTGRVILTTRLLP